MSYNPNNPNGSATSANSAPVVIASDQASVTTDTENLVVKDDFSGSTLNSSNWTVTQKTGSSQTYSVASSLLTINAETVANDWLTFTSVKTFTLPFRVQFIVHGSQAIANNNLYLEVVNASGTSSTASATTAVTTGTTQIAYVMTGATATTGNIVAQNQGVKSTADTAVTIATTANYSVYEIDAYMDSVTFATRTTDAAVAQTSNSTMRQRTILDPGEAYYVQIRSLNGGTAPASNTVFTVEAVVIQDTTDSVVAISGGRGNNDVSRGLPISSIGILPTLGTVTTVSTVSTVSSVTNGNLGLPAAVADIASAALTTTSTSATLTPTFGTAYQVNIPVTAVTGTSPTLDIEIQESKDTGTNWIPIYDFPRITATGSYNSPVMTLTGNRVRYVQTVGGTTPSFTRAVNRNQESNPGNFFRQVVDRTISLTTLNSTTPSCYADMNTNNVQLVINVGAITTTAPILQIQATEDAGASWYNVGSPLTAVASSTVSTTVNGVTAQLFRAQVTTAGSGVTAGYTLLRAFDN